MKRLKTFKEFLNENEEYDEEYEEDEDEEEDEEDEELPILTSDMVDDKFLNKYLDRSYDLIYVDYNDNLDDYLKPAMEKFHKYGPDEALDYLYDIVNDAYYENDSAYENADEVLDSIREDYTIEDEDEIRELLIDEIRSRDSSTPFSDLINRTEDIKVFYGLEKLYERPGEDSNYVISSNKLLLKRLGLPVTPENREAMDTLIKDCEGEMNSLGVIFEFAIDDFFKSFSKYEELEVTGIYLCWEDGRYSGGSVKLDGTLKLKWKPDEIEDVPDNVDAEPTCNYRFIQKDPTD